MNHLVPCPECSRHVRVSEKECPFCALPLDLANTPPPQLPRSRLSRAATLAFGATFVSATAISACGGDAEESGVPNAGAAGLASGGAAGLASGGANVGGAVPLYGAPAGGANVVPPYGSPPAFGGSSNGAPDAGMGGTIDLPGAAGASGEAGAGAAPDASGGKGGGPVPVYGAPH